MLSRCRASASASAAVVVSISTTFVAPSIDHHVRGPEQEAAIARDCSFGWGHALRPVDRRRREKGCCCCRFAAAAAASLPPLEVDIDVDVDDCDERKAAERVFGSDQETLRQPSRP